MNTNLSLRAGLALAERAALLAVLALPAAAGDLDPRRVPEDARLLVHVDVEGFLASTVGQLLASQRGELAAGLDLDELAEFEEEFGLDPFRDVRSVTVFGSGTDWDHTVVSLTVSERIERALERLQTESAYRSFRDQGFEIHSWDGQSAFAWIDRPRDPAGDRIVVIGDSMADVVNAAKVARGQAPSLHRSPNARVAATPTAGAFLYVAVSGELPGLHDAGEASAIFDLARDLSLEIGEARASLFARLTVTTAEEQDARDVVDILQGIKAIAQLALRSQEDVPREVGSLLSALHVERRGNLVFVDFDYPTAELIEDLRALAGDELYR